MPAKLVPVTKTALPPGLTASELAVSAPLAGPLYRRAQRGAPVAAL